MMTEFIFMLTHHDVTIPNAFEVLEEVKDTGLKYVGCKDIGLPLKKLKELFNRMKNLGLITFLEVVSGDEEKHFEGVKKAIHVGADYLIGGMPQFTRKTLDYIRREKSDLKFFPYIGRVVGHPCILEGDVEEIVANGREFENLGVDGINLLLYRYRGDREALLNKITAALKIPIIVAGSIDSFEKIEQLKRKNIWAFTIGGAVLERKFVPGGGIREQVIEVLKRL